MNRPQAKQIKGYRRYVLIKAKFYTDKLSNKDRIELNKLNNEMLRIEKNIIKLLKINK